MNEDVARDLYAVGHGCVVEEPRMVHAFLDADVELAVRRGLVPFTGADPRFQHHPVAIISAQSLSGLVDYHPFRGAGRRGGLLSARGQRSDTEHEDKPSAHVLL